ncbi:Xanthan lyase precursor [Polystyrenella longa]|uniref:Xanthan lyase n=1 Tax=Polystyrenella longa TaxID=2528007 RepID=A0A518CNM8_9PLAN|nr:FAD-dependent oxidoreductase [Polystyrenella longa]QDU80830.1 Xanthan lyase precursor [Polystyrenella longa]
MRTLIIACLLITVSFVPRFAIAETVLVEAESFESHGGWKLDTQFIQNMGSPYLLAHGLGKAVADAETTVTFPKTGTYHVFVRTKDWVARWKQPGTPGRFQLNVNGTPLEETFGTKSANWFWQSGGTVDINQTEVELSLHDLTGFDGRCDAILFTTDKDFQPDNSSEAFASWRQEMLGNSVKPTIQDYDLVVAGGGYSGMGAAISAARMGCKVALIQNRPVLGGNGSSEIRVWAQGLLRRGKYPHIGEIVQEFADSATQSPGTKAEFEDEKKEAIVRAEANITLFLNHHVYAAQSENEEVQSVTAFDTRSGAQVEFHAPLFVDATGHGVLGALVNADFDMLEEGHMGMSNMWRWEETEKAAQFPEVPWALQLKMDDFPYPRRGHGEWFWEGGFDRHPIEDLEYVRDWNLRAVYGAFNAMKNGDGAEKHQNAALTWIAYIGGPRESRRLLGDVLLTREDITGKKEFPDGCVPTTWDIDLHYPKKRYMQKYPEDPFISYAEFDRSVDKNYGYPVPYRCFYSRNINNLFMAGRCISVTHGALGTVRVMKTCGMMGEVVGKAASICKIHGCSPRDVYTEYWPELDELMNLPGRARRETVDSELQVTGSALPYPVRGVSRETLKGIVLDNTDAFTTGNWHSGHGVNGFVGDEYLYAGKSDETTIRYTFTVPTAGEYEVGLSFTPHENRTKDLTVHIEHEGKTSQVKIDQTKVRKKDQLFVPLGKFGFTPDATSSVFISAAGVTGYVAADAVQILPVE